tara:strand:+ start:358 stop:585 length:228 start_codon:yes stop_codon:yes gene_type:complete
MSSVEENNISILKKDIENNWLWTEKTINDIEEIKREQEEILKLIKKNEELVEKLINFITDSGEIDWERITDNTNL